MEWASFITHLCTSVWYFLRINSLKQNCWFKGALCFTVFWHILCQEIWTTMLPPAFFISSHNKQILNWLSCIYNQLLEDMCVCIGFMQQKWILINLSKRTVICLNQRNCWTAHHWERQTPRHPQSLHNYAVKKKKQKWSRSVASNSL